MAKTKASYIEVIYNLDLNAYLGKWYEIAKFLKKIKGV